MRRRERRRWLTDRHAHQQYKIWYRSRNIWRRYGSEPLTCPVGWFKKLSAMHCNCRKHRAGNPKIPIGVCFGYDCGEAYIGRRRWKKALYQWGHSLNWLDCEA